jgi:hypothetical protein
MLLVYLKIHKMHFLYTVTNVYLPSIALFILGSLTIKCFLYLKDPGGKVVITSCSHEEQSSVTLKIPQESTDLQEMEDDLESGEEESMNVPLIP